MSELPHYTMSPLLRSESRMELRGDEMAEAERVEHHADGDLRIVFHANGSETRTWLSGPHTGVTIHNDAMPQYAPRRVP